MARKIDIRLLRFAALLGFGSIGPATAQEAPSTIFGPLFEAVQTSHIFADSKAFADAIPKRDPAAILADYESQKPTGPALKAFVLANFIVRGQNDQYDLRTHVRALWPQLIREPEPIPRGSSALPLESSYVVPGGRFQEIYYWDTYFTMLGLKADGRQSVVESMIDNFTSIIERYGHIPNGTRTYYLTRSQPPYFALMLDLSDNRSVAVGRRRLAALRTEYAFWMKGADCLGQSTSCLRVVKMPDGSLLNRNYDDSDTPRDESFIEDLATAKEAAPRAPADVYRDLRAAAESGWDFTSRWLARPDQLSSIRTTDIVPIDLNSLLWAMERRISTMCEQLGYAKCSREFSVRAKNRRAAIDRYLWLNDEGRYADWVVTARKATPILSAATLEPLFLGLASKAQADAVAETTRRCLLAQGGLRTTTLKTGQQWDEPNGWAPLQWVAIEGLSKTGHGDLAKEIAQRWISTVKAAYAETGKMLEKYNVDERTPGGGGEYPVQDGFGWTNGVTSVILSRYPDLN